MDVLNEELTPSQDVLAGVVNGVGVNDIDEVSDVECLKPLSSRKQVASDLMPVDEAPCGNPPYDWAGKDV